MDQDLAPEKAYEGSLEDMNPAINDGKRIDIDQRMSLKTLDRLDREAATQEGKPTFEKAKRSLLEYVDVALEETKKVGGKTGELEDVKKTVSGLSKVSDFLKYFAPRSWLNTMMNIMNTISSKIDDMFATLSRNQNTIDSRFDQMTAMIVKLQNDQHSMLATLEYTRELICARPALRKLLEQTLISAPDDPTIMTPISPATIELLMAEASPDEILAMYPPGGVTDESRVTVFTAICKLKDICNNRRSARATL